MRYDKKELSKIAAVFKALGHPIRLWIVRRLGNGECCVCDIVDTVGVDFSTVSQHLNVLKRAGVVEDEKRGKHVFYRLVCPCIPWLVERMELRDSMTEEQIALWNAMLKQGTPQKETDSRTACASAPPPCETLHPPRNKSNHQIAEAME